MNDQQVGGLPQRLMAGSVQETVKAISQPLLDLLSSLNPSVTCMTSFDTCWLAGMSLVLHPRCTASFPLSFLQPEPVARLDGRQDFSV
jgi:hypothetical protein